MGAGGREFHNFNVLFRKNDAYDVVAFTACQIPNIAGRQYPAELSGPLYPAGIPIYPEELLRLLIKKHGVTLVVFSYSDVSHEYVMRRASIASASGADFTILSASRTMIPSKKPVIAVCATRTGSGKSQVSRKIARLLREKGIKTAAIRHPMPYGDLKKQIVQKFSLYEDFNRYDCTIEEREEYEPYIEQGMSIFAGADYEKIVQEAEKEADVILWDGGNNDTPFIKPDMLLTVLDPHRAGQELTYFPGETNFLMADVFCINKLNDAPKEGVATVLKNIRAYSPNATIIRMNSIVSAKTPELVTGKRVLAVEDGPTVTHGNMSYGAGYVAAKKYRAKMIIDPRPFAVGTIKETLAKFPHLTNVLPAMGYGKEQQKDLAETINRSDCDVVLAGTTIDLAKLLPLNKPVVRITYDVEEIGHPNLSDILDEFLTQNRK